MLPCISSRWVLNLHTAIATLALLATACVAQEVASVDASHVAPRTELRYPPVAQASCENDGPCTGGARVSVGIGCGAESPKDPRAIRTTLTWLDYLAYEEGEEAEFEVRLENVGTVSLRLPGTPHLADLQPADESVPFDYYSLSISLEILPFVGIGSIQLYGTDKASLITVHPGEWVRVRGRAQLYWNDQLKRRAGSGAIHETLTAFINLQKVKFIPHPRGHSTSITNLYPRRLRGDGLFIEFRKRQQPAVASVRGRRP